LESSDRNWIGAWWIAYLVGTITLFLPVIPMLGFPKLFPNTKALMAEKRKFKDVLTKKVGVDGEELKNNLKNIIPATTKLLKNSAFVCFVLSTALELLTINGFSIFLPKVLETQFHIIPSKAGLYVGFAILPG
jgi:Organic Anion Transporter Polypeptide (OATP) family.